MATKTDLIIPKVVRGTRPPSDTAQTPGLIRRPAIDGSAVGASKIWFGTVTSEPNHKGPPHMHGEAETAAYVISGHVRVYYGEDFLNPGPWVPVVYRTRNTQFLPTGEIA